MRDFNTKIDNDNTSAGVVVADEYNSIFGENKNAITPFMGLNEADSQQLIKSIDIVSKAMFYTDTGTPNAVILERGATTQTIEILFDGMVVMFTPANANTGATTLKIKTLDAKPLYYNGAVLESGFLKTTSKYIAIYDVSNGRFNVDLLVNKADLDGLNDTLPLLGVLQTWQDLTASRAFSTVYTNTTGKPIGVCVTGVYNGSINRRMFAKINGTTLIGSADINDSSDTTSFSFIVPDGDTYEVVLSSANEIGLFNWSELR